MHAILDSNALVSLISDSDALHIDALGVRQVANERSFELLLPYEVLAETLNVFGRRMGKDYTIRAGETLVSLHMDNELRLVDSATRIVGRALALQNTAKGAPSFVDCLVMAYADTYGTTYIFGFDATFRKNGYRLPGDETSTRAAA